MSLTLLKAGKIHLWHFNITQSIDWETLSPDEKIRAEQFYFEKDRIAYAFSRATLRCVLSQYIAIEPSTIKLNYTLYGKPFLDPSQNAQQLHFNVSHTHHCVVYAITKNDEVGVDVEYVKKNIDYAAIAKHFFSSQEYALINQAHPSEKCDIFYRIWTCKEAFIKALGLGLSYTLNDFDVGELSNNSAKILRIKNDFEKSKNWSLFCWTPMDGYVAALAVEREAAEVVFYGDKQFMSN